MQYPLSSFFLRGCVARRSKAAHISRSSPHQVLGNSHEKRLDVDEVLYQHYVKKLLVGYLERVAELIFNKFNGLYGNKIELVKHRYKENTRRTRTECYPGVLG